MHLGPSRSCYKICITVFRFVTKIDGLLGMDTSLGAFTRVEIVLYGWTISDDACIKTACLVSQQGSVVSHQKTSSYSPNSD
ncbi:hypothetical protein GJ744_006183 [Endocarpon pusillum]|uniref:Uncharacterized protein n=1 Tax=Endocarpon pusillum TaxID=364733 RepID=A0A8H7ANZ5_9EURO|nr:hypothetical protein GJ744_006183 [Endocarpon pusillum]